MIKKFNKHKLTIGANTDVYCIFGNPVRHSLSPAMHNAAFRALGINAAYVAFEAGSIKEAINAMKALGIRGASVTIPFKTEAIKYIDKTDSSAAETGSVNTLRNDNGIITGYNTDGYGALKAIADSGARITDTRVLIIGNGGSARAIAFSLLSEGASVVIGGRNSEKISRLIKDIKKKHSRIEFKLINQIDKQCTSDIDIIINTTPIGMSPDMNIPIDPELILEKHTVFDIVYTPHETRLLELSKNKGCRIIHGIEMLVNQGAKQFEIWMNREAPILAMRRAVKKYMAD